jgi:hypothetical protein
MSLRPENDEEVLQALDRRMNGHGNGERTAREMDIDVRYLRAMKSGERRVSKQVAGLLGFELRWVRRK